MDRSIKAPHSSLFDQTYTMDRRMAIAGAWQPAEVLVEAAGAPRQRVGTVNLSGARMVAQLRSVLLAELPPDSLPERYVFVLDGSAVSSVQEEAWPAVALHGGVVVRAFRDNSLELKPEHWPLAIQMQGEAHAIGTVKVTAATTVREVRDAIIRDMQIAPSAFALLDRAGVQIEARREDQTLACQLSGQIVAVSTTLGDRIAASGDIQQTTSRVASPAAVADCNADTPLDVTAHVTNEIGAAEDLLLRDGDLLQAKPAANEAAEKEEQLMEEGKQRLAAVRHQFEKEQRLQDVELQAKQHSRMLSAQEQSAKLERLEKQLNILEGALQTRYEREDPNYSTPAALVELEAEAKRIAITAEPMYAGVMEQAFTTWCKAQTSGAVDASKTTYSEWIAAHGAEQAAKACERVHEGVHTLPEELPAAPPEACGFSHRHFAALWDRSNWQVQRFRSAQPPAAMKRLVMAQVWKLQALLDFQYCQREPNSLYNSDAGPWRIIKVLDPHGDTGIVLKAVRSCGDSIQVRAVMLLPKPSEVGASRKLTKAEIRALERPTLLGSLNSPSLPAAEAEYSVTPDYRLGWRFMEYLGDELATMDKDAKSAMEDSVPKRCYQAIKYGLKLLAALRPLHERGLVHAAFAPKHIVRVDDGTQTEYKLLGLGNLHLEGEKSHAVLKPGVKEFASPEVQILSNTIDRRADLYSVGMILFSFVAANGLPPAVDLEVHCSTSPSAHTDPPQPAAPRLIKLGHIPMHVTNAALPRRIQWLRTWFRPPTERTLILLTCCSRRSTRHTSSASRISTRWSTPYTSAPLGRVTLGITCSFRTVSSRKHV